MIVRTNTNNFGKIMNNILNYSYGFLDGVNKGKPVFLDNLGKGVILALGKYIDVNAKANPKALHHVYEWYRTGSPSARLFDVQYIVNRNGLSLFSNFRQSKTVSADATEPFYNKAQIMELGKTVVIKPKGGGALRFESGGDTVYTKKPVAVRNPGGNEVRGSYEEVFDEFMLRYFKQSFIRSSGLYDYIEKPTLYKKNISAGAKMGRQKGISTGFAWIANARIGVQ
jgi:hypothetical protein